MRAGDNYPKVIQTFIHRKRGKLSISTGVAFAVSPATPIKAVG